jgi:2-oxoglutarate ferredoxin oxidoreductase subunit alpha
MDFDMLEAGTDFGRYLDVDGDGIPYRTLPGTHPTRGAYFTRGTTRNPYAKYSEAGPDYVYNMERLLRKFETAKALVPQPLERRASDAVLAKASPGALRRAALRLDRARDDGSP